MGVKMSILIQQFLEEASGMLRKSGHLCISAPREVEVERYAYNGGFKVKEAYLVRVHRSLTRRISVLYRA
jgi:tRNA (guanine10-N2)-dimethyltransferase